jgi:hypothetical protein
MAEHVEILNLLEKLSHDAELDPALVRDFQERIWNTKPVPGQTDRILEVLSELAYDLDFWEPDPAKRREDPSFFDDARARAEIQRAIERLRGEGVDLQG